MDLPRTRNDPGSILLPSMCKKMFLARRFGFRPEGLLSIIRAGRAVLAHSLSGANKEGDCVHHCQGSRQKSRNADRCCKIFTRRASFLSSFFSFPSSHCHAFNLRILSDAVVWDFEALGWRQDLELGNFVCNPLFYLAPLMTLTS